MTETQEAPAVTEPFVGQPATIHLYSDSVPAVVTRVNKKSVQVRRVFHDESTRRRVNDEREPFPVYAWDGDLTRVIGAPERYSRVETSDGPRYRNGSVSVTLGRSVKITDYRH